jgi:nitrite reductase/ring-hydroxylating ferredoxin subunit
MAEPETTHASRRAIVAGTALACVGVACSGLVAGCATYNANNGGVGGAPVQGGAASAGSGSTGPAGGGAGSGGAGSGGTGPAALATTSQVPVGGGTINNAQKVVITQPDAGSYKAFTAVCTHQGCTVDAVVNGTIDCPCHGSRFSIKDGSVVNGPAASPLASVAIKVQGTSILLA